ncbi:MAG: T9SS type A sorting domain-containing protein, partial [Chitinophagales bacterium]
TIEGVETESQSNLVSLRFNYHSEKTLQVMVYDAVGKLLYAGEASAIKGENAHQMDFTAASSGMYILTITDGIEVASTKILKQ